MRGARPNALRTLAEAAGRFLALPNGPAVAVLEAGGWDTHANQGSTEGTLANRLRALDEALGALREHAAPSWSRTVILVASEFGRTVRPNGSRGTDHGTATAAILTGGAIAGGRVLADWPGLAEAALREGRDLAPTLDLRAILKSVLRDHLGVTAGALERSVFPGSAAATVPSGLVRSV